MANTNAGSKFSTAKWILILVIVVVSIVLIQKTLAYRNSASVVPQDAASTKAIEERIKPLGEVSIAAATHTAPVVAASAPVTGEAAPAKTSTESKAGETTYNSICTGCHSTGALGAPKLGDKAAWAPRIAQGIEVLYASALKGKNSMPAKGGNPSLSDADVKATVDYIVAASK
ncbi:MAG: c-type cytochrome [Burkholderiales bacterium]